MAGVPQLSKENGSIVKISELQQIEIFKNAFCIWYNEPSI